MRVRILTETPHVAGRCSEVVEADAADPTVAELLKWQLLEPADPAAEPTEPGKKAKK